MKEYSYLIRDALINGLRRYEMGQRNSPFLTELFNLKPKEWGLEPYDSVQLPFLQSTLDGENITIGHPFPQLFRGRETTILADETKLYWVDESDWSLTEITIYDAYNIKVTKAITAGGPWQFADFGTNWMLFNGSCVVFNGPYGTPLRVVVQDSVTMNAGCAHRGRGILAGFNPSNFWRDDWQSLWDTWLGNLSTGITVDESMKMGSNFVMWTTIGGGDLYWTFYPEFAVEGHVPSSHSETRTLLMDTLKRNEWGFMPMPWQGTVLVVKPLGKDLMVYGDGGISILTPYMEPAPTYGLQHIMSIGIAGRGAVGGDDNTHVFLDEAGFLWKVEKGGVAKRLGYKEYLYSMLGNDVVISYDKQEDEFYICDNNKGFVLTDRGLGEMNQLVNSLGFTDGGLVGMFESVSDNEARIVTDVLDMDYRSIKNLEVIEVGVDTAQKVEVAVDYRYRKSGSFVRSSFKELNGEGVARATVAGLEFRLAVKADGFSDVNVDYINAKWKLVDKRSVRGLGARSANI